MPSSPDNTYRRALRRLKERSAEMRSQYRAAIAPLQKIVCAEYPGGPSGYRYVPEHCVPSGPKSSASPSKPSKSTKSKEKEAYKRLEEYLTPPPLKKTISNESTKAPPELEKYYFKAGAHILSHYPLFLVHAVPQYIARMAKHPDETPHTRYVHIATAWKHPYSAFFQKNKAAEAAVFALVAASSAPPS